MRFASFWSPLARWVRSDHLSHHLRAATIVASVVTLLHSAGLLGGLDGFMQRLIGSAGPVWRTRSAAPASLPAVLLVGEPLYERAFSQASPLAPAGIAQIVDAIPRKPGERPATVVIDLDLSPGPDERVDDPGRGTLDDALRRQLAAGTRVVLPLPIRVSTPGLQQVKHAWIRRLCGWNLHLAPGPGRLDFGLSDVITHGGSVMQFDPQQPTLGVVAATPAATTLCDRALDPSGRWRAPLVGSQFPDSALVAIAAVHEFGLRPFNARFFSADDRNVQVLDTLDAGGWQAALGPLAGRALFIGTGLTAQPRFLMPLEHDGRPVEGVVVHAATYYSVAHPVTIPSDWKAFALDVALGVVMGYAFAWSWRWHLHVGVRCRSRAGLAAHWAPRGSLLMNLLLAAASIALSVVVADAFFFPLNLWVNPVPIVLGVFVKFLIATRVSHDDAHADPHAGAPRAWRHRLDDTLLLLLTGSALATLALGSH